MIYADRLYPRIKPGLKKQYMIHVKKFSREFYENICIICLKWKMKI